MILWIGHPRDLISCLVAMGAARCTDSACDCGGHGFSCSGPLWQQIDYDTIVVHEEAMASVDGRDAAIVGALRKRGVGKIAMISGDDGVLVDARSIGEA